MKRINPSEDELMVMRVSLVEPDFELDIFKSCKVFDYHKIWLKDGPFNEILSDFGTKEEAIDASMQLLKGILVRSLA
jgi:hypothetical protein